MIIKEIELRNIRSYKEARIDFPLGKTLFEGDIGSGKSTILMAIEFAFFGLGSETGSSLLRIGEKEGGVRMVFDVDGKEFEITRGLSRKEARVHQTAGVLRTPEGQLDLSPKELKEEILDILHFDETPDPRAQSRIYRYAVYTPQEAMKTILVLTPDDRLQTLRRVFGIEDYKTANENAEELTREVRRRVENLNAKATDYDEAKSRVARQKEQRDSLLGELELAKVLESKSLALLERLKTEKEKLRDEEVRLKVTVGSIAGDEELIKARSRDASEWMHESEELGREMAGGERTITDLMHATPVDRKAEDISEAIRETEERCNKLRTLAAKISTKADEYHSLLETGVCPVCDKPADAHEFVSLEKAKRDELAHVSEELQVCESKLRTTREELERRRVFDLNQEKIRLLQKELGEHQEEIVRNEVKIQRARQEVGQARERLTLAKKEMESLAEVGRSLNELERNIRNAEGERTDATNKVVEARTRIGELSKRIADDEETARRMEKLIKKAAALKEDEVWLQDYFEPTLEAIEKQVMLSINQDFNANFQKWFGMLIDDPEKEVRIDEKFVPIISQEGYEQEVDFLSGGERTSVALAYRLALNTLVQRVSTGMRSNLLILDEPTDGFSQEQLGNVREVLDDVGSPQMILVSHEKELESFADQICRISKSQGESHIASGRE